MIPPYPTTSRMQEVRITVLRSSPRSAPWALGEKKKIAKEVDKLADEVKNDIGDIDITNRTDMLTIFNEILKQYSSNKKIVDMNNDGHSNLLVQILNIADTIHHHKRLKRLQSMGHRTRPAALQSEEDMLRSAEDRFYNKCVDLLKKVDVVARDKIEAEKNRSNKLLKGLILEQGMVGRRFDSSRQPQDPAHHNMYVSVV